MLFYTIIVELKRFTQNISVKNATYENVKNWLLNNEFFQKIYTFNYKILCVTLMCKDGKFQSYLKKRLICWVFTLIKKYMWRNTIKWYFDKNKILSLSKPL